MRWRKRGWVGHLHVADLLLELLDLYQVIIGRGREADRWRAGEIESKNEL